MDKDEIINAVQKALECQWELYSWDNMIDDVAEALNWNEAEINFAKRELTARVELAEI